MLTANNAIVGEDRTDELPRSGIGESGFTLIELMVVLLIIAILLAIAIPTFLGVSGAARDRAAQSNLTNAVTDTLTYYQNGQTFDATSDPAGPTLCSQDAANTGCAPADTDTPSALRAYEPAFKWVVNGSTACTSTTDAARCMSALPVDVNSTNDGQGVILAVLSGTGTCWYVLHLEIVPEASAAEASPTGFAAGQSSLPITTPGTYYAKESVGGSITSVTCSAAHAQGFADWYDSYSAARSE
jgi:type IV pilus assembly protein PilA